jgi:hypothetical protein
MNDMNPAKSAAPAVENATPMGGKASAWLAKGKQAVKNLEKKKVDGFVVPPVVGSWADRTNVRRVSS